MGWIIGAAFLAVAGLSAFVLRARGIAPRRMLPGAIAAIVFGCLVGVLTWLLSFLADVEYTVPDRLLGALEIALPAGAVAFTVFALLLLLGTIGAKGAPRGGGSALAAVVAPVLVVVGFIGILKGADAMHQAQIEHQQDIEPFEVHDRNGVQFDASLVAVDRVGGHPSRIVVDMRLRATEDVRFLPDTDALGSPGVCFAERRVGQLAQGPCWTPDVAAPVPSELPDGYDRTTRITFTPPPIGLGSGDRFDLYVSGSTADDRFVTFGATTFVIEP